MSTHGALPVRGQDGVPRSPQFEGRFGRMFRRLPPCPLLGPDELTQIAEGMREPGQPAGWGGVPQDFDNPSIPAGYTYFGQFVDHDITFDPVSSLDHTNDPNALTDFRTPRFDLDSVYGSGPRDEPFMYLKDDRRKLLLGQTDIGEFDLPRNSDGLALIGDPRNDENIIVSQFHVAMIRLHNKFVDILDNDPGVPAGDVFDTAQRLTRWHYQRVIVDDYLRSICGDALIDALFGPDPTSGKLEFHLDYYLPRTRPYMPVEFSVAAFRFGHSMVRGIYNLNDVVVDRPIFATGDDVGELDDLRGNRPLPSHWAIDWSLFFPINGSNPQLSRLIDSKLVPALFDLPGGGPGAPLLALLNLRRGQALELPSGQDVARYLEIEPVRTGAELGVVEPTPLWFYILKESELETGGHTLGKVGARIVAEVLLGLLRTDTQSWINQNPTWQPTIPATGPKGRLTLGDLVQFAQA